jgi:hypothetical protein
MSTIKFRGRPPHPERVARRRRVVAALTAVGLSAYDPARFLAADHYGGFAVGIVVIATGVRALCHSS